jgi:hypothetical protein
MCIDVNIFQVRGLVNIHAILYDNNIYKYVHVYVYILLYPYIYMYIYKRLQVKALVN